MCRNYLRCSGKVGENIWEPYNRNLKGNTSSSRGVRRIELGNLLENFKTNILGVVGSSLDALQSKKRKEEEHARMSIFFQYVGLRIPKGIAP